MTERIAPLLRWAEGYFPSRLIEPPDMAQVQDTCKKWSQAAPVRNLAACPRRFTFPDGGSALPSR